ncbi:hypothetical protein OPW07_07135 [Vibrio europaeus]|uniref:hypothetical protein n=1 Tax=Vibrio europaeus TaxID=300876 RepID=UPI001E613836|nr:hypothetical protein [Vibrio europaeus]MDC5809490.1 hypothetical protein [Vibrio europaeus]
MHAKILSYLGKLRQSPLSQNESRNQIKLVSITDQLESIADLVVNNMLPLCYNALDANIQASPEMRDTLDRTHSSVNQALLDSVNAIRREDTQLAESLLNVKLMYFLNRFSNFKHKDFLKLRRKGWIFSVFKWSG